MDTLDWLEQQRDQHATARDAAYAADDWKTGNEHDDLCRNYYACIVEIREARKRLTIFSEVLQKRIIIAADRSNDCSVMDRGNP
jgi:hypothetical protein